MAELFAEEGMSDQHGQAAVGAPRGYRPRHPKSNRYRHYAEDTRDVVRNGELTEEEADRAWEIVRDVWGLRETNSDQREAFLGKLTEALAFATSKSEENLETRFMFETRYFALRDLADAVSVVVQVKNDTLLRMFVRSWRGAELAVRIYDYVDISANVGIRQELALHTGGPPEHAPYMIDVSDAVVRHSGRTFTTGELSLMNHYRSCRTNKAREAAQAVGQETTRQDTSSRIASAVASSASGHADAARAPPAARMGLASVR